MKNVGRKFGTTFTGLLLIGLSAPADLVWTGAIDQNDFTNPGNWFDTVTGVTSLVGADSTTPTQYQINTPGSYAIKNIAGTQQVNATYVGTGANGANITGRLDITNGILQGTGQQGRHTVGQRISNTGTLNISGTGVYDSGGGTRIGLGGGTGYMNLSDTGGFLGSRGINVGGSDYSLAVGLDNGSLGEVNVRDSASLDTRFGIRLGSGTGVGTLNIVGSDVAVQNGELNAGADGSWYQGVGSTLGAEIDSSDFSLSAMTYRTNNGTSFVTIEAGAILNPTFSGAATAGTWTLMQFDETTTITDGGFVLANPNWTYAFADTDATPGVDALQVTYLVPEPSSAALIGLGGLLVLTRLRRRA